MKVTNVICVNEVKANKASASYGVLFFAMGLAGVVLTVYPFYMHADMSEINYSVVAGILIVPFGFIGFLRSCYRSVFYFDLENERYKQEDGYGPFKWGEWKAIGKIEYVSVFRQFYADQDAYDEEKDIRIAYDVNLWYTEDKYVTLSSYKDKLSAFKFAKRLALQLNIRMLDSTMPNDYVWVELYDTN